MGDADVKDDAPKQLGRIVLKRRPAAEVSRPRDPASRHAQLVSLSEKYGVPALDLDQVCLRTEDLGNVPRSLAQHHLLIPVLARTDRLFVAMKDPSLLEVIQEVEFVAGKRVYAYVAPAEDIAEAIERAYLARERGAEHFVGPSCPPEMLRRAGLLAEEPVREPVAAARLPQEVPPPSELSLPDETTRVPRALPQETIPVRDAGPPATVSAHPPQLSSLPPALRRKLSEGEDEAANVLSAVEEAFAELLDEPSTVGQLPKEPPPGAATLASSRAVLIVDDDADSRALLESVLLDEGYIVRAANNGRRALRLIKECTPDLLLLAALLPEVHGFEIARRLRGSQRYGNLPIVMISAVYRGWRLAEELRDSCGVEHYIEKPLRPEEIKRAVAAALEAYSPPVEATSDLSTRAEQALVDGMDAYRRGALEEAIGHLERGVGIDPLAYRLHFHLGLLLAQQGQTYDAIRALERAVEINSRHFAGVKNLAIMYCQAGFRNRAVKLWTHGLRLAPDDETREAIQEHLAALLSQEGLS
jgi:CheY-like chemotaxis protein